MSSTSNQSQEGDGNRNELNDHDRITRVATGVLCVIQVTFGLLFEEYDSGCLS